MSYNKAQQERVKERPGSVLNTFPCCNGNIHQARENPFIVFYQDPNSSWGPKTIALSSFFGSLQCTGCLGTPVCQKKHGSVLWQGCHGLRSILPYKLTLLEKQPLQEPFPAGTAKANSWLSTTSLHSGLFKIFVFYRSLVILENTKALFCTIQSEVLTCF